MFIDTHAHLNFSAFDNDLDQVVLASLKNGVGKILNVGAKLDSSKKVTEVAQLYPELYASVGVHPHHADEFSDEVLKKFEELAKNPKVVAIGEIGLDFHEYVSETKPGFLDRKIQEKVFLAQIFIAKKLHLPIIIHSRKSIEELIPLVVQLKKHEFPNMQAVFHCWSDKLDYAKQIADLGFYLSFTAILTYPKNGHLREVIKYLPLEQMLLETDSPYLPPQNKRGLRNTPETVKIIAQRIADIKNTSLEKVEDVSTNNAEKLFNFKY